MAAAPGRARLGFVGAGRMGRPMVRRLLAAGHPVTVLERTPGACRDLAAQGAAVTADVPGTADADIVLVCVRTDAQVRDVCLDEGLTDALRPGTVLIVHTTCDPRTVDALGERVRARGADVVDAGVSGGPHDIAAGRLTLYVGGADDMVARVKPVLQAYGDPVLHLGPSGTGQRVKLLNNAVFAAHLGILAHTVALATELGIPEPDVLRGLTHGSGSSRALDSVAALGSVGRFAASVGEFLGKDLAVVRDVTSRLGLELGPLTSAHDILAELLAPASGVTHPDE
ncbi:NAD(P)-dependent oxidoreductase [Streptomyces sp. NPDC052052]|uniref:NAD(P)-dependent oxidoreductase n=1 Tax=Streptomyces sp. NPDC052052 TaxID=3154756 RepID=UPI0034425FC9